MIPAAVSRVETAADVAAAEACLTTAFAADPFTRWVMRDPAQFLAGFRHTLKHMGRLGQNDGVGLLAAGGAGAALWLPPGAQPDMEALGLALADMAMPEEAPELFGQMGALHPHAPHWYLPFIGVDPASQGRGMGTALLESALALVDAEGMPAYLESTNPRNVPLYERFGFRVVGEIQAGGSPVMHPMWRAAR